MVLLADKKKSRTGTFVDNLSLPVHRWFRYSAGFSAEWVTSVIRSRGATHIIDPFVGSGTTLLAADAVGVRSLGFESHVFVKRIAESKISWDYNKETFTDLARRLVRKANSFDSSVVADRTQDRLLGKMYSRESLHILESLRLAHTAMFPVIDSKEGMILWLGITSILRACSHAGTAQWQYVLPKKTKKNAKNPLDAFENFCDQVIDDSFFVGLDGWKKGSTVLLHDARERYSNHSELFDLLITSPPYPNNYDYADATRLEMTFWGEIEGWKDLQSVVRRNLLRSCSQHTAAERLSLNELLSEEIINPIKGELQPVCERLAEVRLTRGGRKTYHTMIAAYFLDLAKILRNLRPLMADDSLLCFVIGDSAPYGVHVPAERWLGELAISAGYKEYKFEKLRDRNIKWDNRVHKVPLQEGNLWIRG